jgi:hypothetical protein
MRKRLAHRKRCCRKTAKTMPNNLQFIIRRPTGVQTVFCLKNGEVGGKFEKLGGAEGEHQFFSNERSEAEVVLMLFFIQEQKHTKSLVQEIRYYREHLAETNSEWGIFRRSTDNLQDSQMALC